MKKSTKKAIVEFIELAIVGGMTGLIFAIWFLIH